MLSDLLKARVRQAVLPLGALLSHVGLSPNTLTILGLALNVAVAAMLASGHLLVGGALLLPVAAFDMLDGALARATQRSTTFGAFLDSTLDRYAEAAIFLGLLIGYTPLADVSTNAALLLAAVGSLLVSYTRARAEGLGLSCEVGILPRPERIVVLAAGLMLGWTIPALWVLAVLTNLTAVQRILHVRKLTAGE